MRVLVFTASKHGSTEEIGAAIVLELRAQDIEADAKTAGEAVDVAGYDAVIVGSAIYAGHWMKESLSFLEQHRGALARKPVWLFSSGPIGEDKGRDPIAPAYVDKLVTDNGARGHRIFAGKLEPADLSLAERAITKVVRAPSGDFRDWDEIHAWAREIAAALFVPANA